MIKIAMCDDELTTLKPISMLLESEIIQQNFDAEITIITDKQKTVFDAIYNHEVDVLFLDVDFKNSGKNGIEFARDLRNINKDFYLVFLTAHQRYMHISFFAKVFDYLVKPINRDVLEELVNRLKHEFECDNKVFLHLNKWVSVRIDDILYIEKDGNKCKVIANQYEQSTPKTLDNLLDELPNNFCKCHRSYIVNKNKILRIDKKNSYVYFSKDTKCPINSHFDL